MLLGVFAIWQASLFPPVSAEGPGPSFLPILLGIAMCILAGSLLVRSFVSAAGSDGGSFLPSSTGQRNIALIVGGLIVYLLLLEPIGYLPMTIVFMAFLLRSLSRYGWRGIAAISLATSVFAYALFAVWLRVPLPRGILEYMGIYF